MADVLKGECWVDKRAYSSIRGKWERDHIHFDKIQVRVVCNPVVQIRYCILEIIVILTRISYHNECQRSITISEEGFGNPASAVNPFGKRAKKKFELVSKSICFFCLLENINRSSHFYEKPTFIAWSNNNVAILHCPI